MRCLFFLRSKFSESLDMPRFFNFLRSNLFRTFLKIFLKFFLSWDLFFGSLIIILLLIFKYKSVVYILLKIIFLLLSFFITKELFPFLFLCLIIFKKILLFFISFGFVVFALFLLFLNLLSSLVNLEYFDISADLCLFLLIITFLLLNLSLLLTLMLFELG